MKRGALRIEHVCNCYQTRSSSSSTLASSLYLIQTQLVKESFSLPYDGLTRSRILVMPTKPMKATCKPSQISPKKLTISNGLHPMHCCSYGEEKNKEKYSSSSPSCTWSTYLCVEHDDLEACQLAPAARSGTLWELTFSIVPCQR